MAENTFYTNQHCLREIIILQGMMHKRLILLANKINVFFYHSTSPYFFVEMIIEITILKR
jgi:hypothetical protein